ncbi:MAG: pur operon repressor [Firmicutes bacterium]|nr:pur operon repressor [Bacillota bacterium]
MGKLPRSERLVAITKDLIDRPHSLIPLGRFSEAFNAAKSSISEDVAIIKRAFEDLRLGKIETVAGAGGGVRFIPYLWGDEIAGVVRDFCEELASPKRILPGGFVYMTDLLFSPSHMTRAGRVFASTFAGVMPDCVLTVETKGIPPAFMTAAAFNVPLAIARRDSQVTEGPIVSINYVSGSTKRLQSMSLARRAIPEGARVLIIDDFMKGGGSAKGLSDLVREFGAETVGIGVLIATAEPREKLVSDFVSLMVLEGVDEEAKRAIVRPSQWVVEGQ